MVTENGSVVLYERAGNVGVLSMNFAPHNQVGKTLSQALIVALKDAYNAGCRAIVIKSNLRHFSAGAEIGLFENASARLHEELDTVGVLRALEELPIPVISAVHGIAVGAGFEIALASDIVIATTSSKMGLVEATLGLHPLMGGIQRLVDRAGAARAKEIVMLGRRHDASTLEKWNIINRVVPESQLELVTMAIAHELANGPTIAHGATKKLVNTYLNDGMRAADDGMREIHTPVLNSDDAKRGYEAFQATGPGSAVFHGQ